MSRSMLVFGGQAGSEGKGKVVGHIALHGYRDFRPQMAVCAFMTNAGHTAHTKNGEKFVVQQIPMSAINPEINLFIGPGSAITIGQLHKEIEIFEKAGLSVINRLWIHPRAVIIEDHHKQTEAEVTKRIASTMKGCGAALAGKVLRHPNTRLMQNAYPEELATPYGNIMVADTTELILQGLARDRDIMIEGAQGFDLDVNLGVQYPNCTSRSCTPTAVVADCGLSYEVLRPFVLATVRTFPIRVGNVIEDGKEMGFSGIYGSREMSWKEISDIIGTPVEERTTVTQRVRRVFEFDFARYNQMLRYCGVWSVALMFFDYLGDGLFGVNTQDQIEMAIEHDKTGRVKNFMEKLFEASMIEEGAVGLSHIGTGPLDADMVAFDNPIYRMPIFRR